MISHPGLFYFSVINFSIHVYLAKIHSYITLSQMVKKASVGLVANLLADLVSPQLGPELTLVIKATPIALVVL